MLTMVESKINLLEKSQNLFEVLAANCLVLVFGDLSELLVELSGRLRELWMEEEEDDVQNEDRFCS